MIILVGIWSLIKKDHEERLVMAKTDHEERLDMVKTDHEERIYMVKKITKNGFTWLKRSRRTNWHG